MLGECIPSAFLSFTKETGAIDEIIAVTFFFSVGIAVLMAPAYLTIYSAFVKMLMMVKDPEAEGFHYLDNKGRSSGLLSRGGDETLQTTMAERYQYFIRSFSFSVISYLVLMIVVVLYFFENDELVNSISNISKIDERVLYGVFVIIMVWPVLNHALFPSFYTRILGYILAILGIGFFVIYLTEETYQTHSDFLDELSLALFFIVLFIGYAMQKVRNIAVLMVLMIELLLLVLVLDMFVYEIYETCISPQITLEELEVVNSLIIIMLITTSFWLTWKLGIMLIKKLVSWYDRNLISDFQLQTFQWMALVTLIFSFPVVPNAEDDLLTRTSLIPVLIFFVGVAIYSILGRGIDAWQTPRTLLYLRVFSADKYSERLFDMVSRYWRHIGPINMIGGPDLALFNLDIREAYYLLFKRKQIHELFIDDQEILQQRLKAISYQPNSDHHFATNEFFCTDNIWKETVSRLAKLSDRVLLDLRDFNEERKGAEFELELLKKMDMIEHTTIIVDSRTDWDSIKNALGDMPTQSFEDRVIQVDSKTLDKGILAHLVS